MDQYVDKNKTPLKFHKFLWYFWLPASLIISLAFIVFMVIAQPVYSWLLAGCLLIILVKLALQFISFLGFFSWKSYAWYSILILFNFNVAMNLFAIFFSAECFPKAVVWFNIGFLVSAVIAILIRNYYFKRKPLFLRSENQGTKDSESLTD